MVHHKSTLPMPEGPMRVNSYSRSTSLTCTCRAGGKCFWKVNAPPGGGPSEVATTWRVVGGVMIGGWCNGWTLVAIVDGGVKSRGMATPPDGVKGGGLRISFTVAMVGGAVGSPPTALFGVPVKPAGVNPD